MICTECGLWELAAGDLACSWCGTSYLRFTVSLHPSELAADDYPPPVQLRVHNESPLGAITLERMDLGQGWITLLPEQHLPHTLGPGSQHTFFLDVDTFAAEAGREVAITVTAQHAPETRTAVLSLQTPGPAGI